MTARIETSRARAPEALRRLATLLRRTLIATGHRHFDGSIDWTSRPHRRVPAAVVALLLRAEVRR